MAILKTWHEDDPKMKGETGTDDYDLSERPPSLKEAAAHLGAPERYLIAVGKRYSRSIEVCGWQGWRPVFYRNRFPTQET